VIRDDASISSVTIDGVFATVREPVCERSWNGCFGLTA